MILSTEVEIKVNSRHKQSLINLGYNAIINELLTIKVKDLPKTSCIKILCKCDVCGIEKYLGYGNYNKNIKNYNYYSCSVKCALSKIKNTNLIKYGVEHVFQFEETKTKIKEANLERYGVDNVFKSVEIKSKIKETNIKKYGVEHATQNGYIKEKTKQTNIQKYGCEYGLQSMEVKNKIKATNLARYGVEYITQLDSHKVKAKQTNLDRYGVEHAAQNEDIKEKTKQTNLARYGVEYITQLDSYKVKTKQTNLRKYGVEHNMQNPLSHAKQQKAAFGAKNYNGLFYRGSYELDFLENYYDIGITKAPTIHYQFVSKNRIYYPDFYYPHLNLIIEIKSDYTYYREYNKNMRKEKACIQQGYNYIVIINKDYTEFKERIGMIDYWL